MTPFALAACVVDPTPVVLSDVQVEGDEAVTTLLHVSWTQDRAATSWLEFDLGDGNLRRSPAQEREAGAHSELILGAPADTTVQFRVVAEDGVESAAHSATTGALPAALPTPEVPIWEPSLAGEAWLLGSVDIDGGEAYTGPFWLFLVDREGRVVWYRDLEWWMSMFPRVARDGSHLVYDMQSFLDPDGAKSVLQRTTLDGRESSSVPVPGLGWCWDELDDGSLLYDRNKGVEAVTLEQVDPDGSQRSLWDCTAWLAQWDADPEHCYTNTVNWSAERDSVLWSTYWGDWVAEIDRPTGAVGWHAGSLPDGLDFVPEDAAFDLQHYPNYTPDGTLLVSTHVPGREGEQRAREFVVDPEGTLTEVWSYGEGVEGWAQYSGEAVRLADGHTLLNYGTGGEVREIDAEGETVWSLLWGDTRTLGHTQLVTDLYALNAGPATGE